MRELSRHIGANTDVPAGDIGVGGMLLVTAQAIDLTMPSNLQAAKLATCKLLTVWTKLETRTEHNVSGSEHTSDTATNSAEF